MERTVVPTLRTRTKSDPAYDELLSRFLTDLGLTLQKPVTSHMQARLLAVDHYYAEAPVFLFAPSVRSFEAISLLYHEIGHVVWEHVLTRTERSRLIGEINKFARAETVEPTMDALREIAADIFGGLVGGHPYCTNLCAFFLSKQRLYSRPNREYPSAAIRVPISRLASRLAGVPSEDLEDPLFIRLG